MEFTYNSQKKVIESEDPDVYVKAYGFLPGRKRWVLFKGDKRIGFFTDQETIEGENIKADKSDFKMINWILSVGEDIPPQAGPYKFQSVEEEREVLGILKDALSRYDSNALVKPKHGVEARFHEYLEIKIARGLMLAK